MSKDKDKRLDQEEDVVVDKKAEIARLNKLLSQRHKFSTEKLLELEDMLFDGMFRATCWLNMSMLMGSTKGTGAYACVIDKLHFVLRDIATRKGLVDNGKVNDGKVEIYYEKQLPRKHEVEA
jgi:hypothetical protein